MTDNILTQALLKEHLDYDPDTGVFTWVKPTMKRIESGELAGCLNDQGYMNIQIFKRKYGAHRLAWLYIYGHLPKNHIDHINGNTSDNRVCNLREATYAQNNQNTCLRKNNTSGYFGVHLHKKTNKWRATIKFDKKYIHLGLYFTPEEAHQAYVAAKAKYHTFNPVLREK